MKAFISYTETDSVKAHELHKKLGDSGFDSWLAGEGLRVADRLSRVHDEIASCDVFFVLLSAASSQSKWVKHEVNTAIAMTLETGRPRVFPVFIEPVSRPPELSDFVSTDLYGENYEKSFLRLLQTIRGEEVSDPRLTTRFRDYICSLPFLADDVVGDIAITYEVALAYANGPLLTSDDQEVISRCRDMLKEALKSHNFPADISGRILAALAQGREMPLLRASESQEFAEWLRQADDTIMRFARDLWGERGSSGVTLDWVFAFLRREDLDFKDKDYFGYAKRYEWKAYRLVEKAFSLGLLVRSTETPRGHYEKIDAESNPSYDLGPTVSRIRRRIAAFITRAESQDD